MLPAQCRKPTSSPIPASSSQPSRTARPPEVGGSIRGKATPKPRWTRVFHTPARPRPNCKPPPRQSPSSPAPLSLSRPGMNSASKSGCAVRTSRPAKSRPMPGWPFAMQTAKYSTAPTSRPIRSAEPGRSISGTAEAPDGATSAEVHLGYTNTPGALWFDDVLATITSPISLSLADDAKPWPGQQDITLLATSRQTTQFQGSIHVVVGTQKQTLPLTLAPGGKPPAQGANHPHGCWRPQLRHQPARLRGQALARAQRQIPHQPAPRPLPCLPLLPRRRRGQRRYPHRRSRQPQPCPTARPAPRRHSPGAQRQVDPNGHDQRVPGRHRSV